MPKQEEEGGNDGVALVVTRSWQPLRAFYLTGGRRRKEGACWHPLIAYHYGATYFLPAFVVSTAGTVLADG